MPLGAGACASNCASTSVSDGWIVGLETNYLPKLPKDPLNTTVATPTYAYQAVGNYTYTYHAETGELIASPATGVKSYSLVTQLEDTKAPQTCINQVLAGNSAYKSGSASLSWCTNNPATSYANGTTYVLNNPK